VRVAALGARIGFTAAAQPFTGRVKPAIDHVLVRFPVHHSCEFAEPRKKAHGTIPDMAIKDVGKHRDRMVQPAEGRCIKRIETKP
jgi:hypothetical protein